MLSIVSRALDLTTWRYNSTGLNVEDEIERGLTDSQKLRPNQREERSTCSPM